MTVFESQLSQLNSKGDVLDLVIVGCGPAGLSLAAESAKRGLSVGLIGPDVPFVNNYGVWVDEFQGLWVFPHSSISPSSNYFILIFRYWSFPLFGFRLGRCCSLPGVK